MSLKSKKCIKTHLFSIFLGIILCIALTTKASAAPVFVRGDVNWDGRVNIADAVSILNYLFLSGTHPPCLDAADTNDDGGVNLSDAVTILSHLFSGAGPLPPPFPQMGQDPTLDDLDCVSCSTNPDIYFDNFNFYCNCNDFEYYAQGRPEICGNDIDENCDGIPEQCFIDPGEATEIATLPNALRECSGLVASRNYRGVLWMHNDSGGENAIFAVRDNGTLIKKVYITDATAVDWEDIAADNNGYLWIADMGNNPTGVPPIPPRRTLTIYKVREPDPFFGSDESEPAEAYQFQYPCVPAEGDECTETEILYSKKDAEALFIWDGMPYIIEKRTGEGSITNMYGFPELTTDKIVTLIELTEITWAKETYITGADISRDGTRLALISDLKNTHLVVERLPSSTTVADFHNRLINIWQYNFDNSKGEGITFIHPDSIDNPYDIYITSEESDGNEPKLFSLPAAVYTEPRE